MRDLIFEKQSLLIKFFNGEASLAEKAEIDNWISLSEENKTAFNKLYSQQYLKDNISRIKDIDTSASGNWKKLSGSLPFSPRVTSFTGWKRYAAAAIVFVSLGSAVYFFSHTNKSSAINSTVAVKPIPVSIPPGGNKAVLTLADGTTILLDSAGNGNLSQQGNTKIIKLDNGQLAYKETKTGGIPSQGGQISSPAKMIYNTIATPKGGQYQIALPDGSKVWLNAASSLRFPVSFSPGAREVFVTGEAYFEIAPIRLPSGSNVPFKVLAENVSIDVLGTSFNINAYADEATTKTTLITGSVKVYKGDAQWQIKPGQQAKMANNKDEVVILNNVAVDETLAWKNGLFHSNSTDIKELMRQIARWYDVDISYEGNVTKATFTGTLYRNMNLSHILKILQLSDVSIKYEMVNNKMKIKVY